jgi:hypothetical protein
MATRTLPEQIADRIVEGMGWQGRVRLGGGALSEQVRIVNDAKHRWVGVTASFTAPSVCTIALGTINADGTFVTPLLPGCRWRGWKPSSLRCPGGWVRLGRGWIGCGSRGRRSPNCLPGCRIRVHQNEFQSARWWSGVQGD